VRDGLVPALAAVVALGGAACSPGIPSVSGVPGASPAPNIAWTPPATRGRVEARQPAAEVPPDLRDRIQQLTLAEIVDLALRNNPTTRAAWANARAAAAAYGSARGAYLPTVDGDVTATRLKTVASQGRAAVEQSLVSPSLTLSYLLLDFGGRGGATETARQGLLAAGYGHNAALQDVVLQVQVAYFQYVANRALLRAQRTSLVEANANLAAAEERRRVGVATIADVLQARTAASQAQLNLESTESTLQTARGALAVSLGLPANLSYDIDSTAAAMPVAPLADSVEALIDTAVRARPDLAAAQAEYGAALGRVAQARGQRLPSLELSGNLARTYATTISDGADSYTLSLGLRIPIFAGFSRIYDQQEAEAEAEVARSRAAQLGQQATFEVFSSYYALQTAARRVSTADDLLASAAQSSEVALGRYKAGVGTALDLLAAQSALAGARAQQIQARLTWNVSLAQLAHDAGVLDTKGGSTLRLGSDTIPPPPAR
jgi:outer membrane protein